MTNLTIKGNLIKPADGNTAHDNRARLLGNTLHTQLLYALVCRHNYCPCRLTKLVGTVHVIEDLQVNRNPIKDREGWWLPPVVVVQWSEYKGSSIQGP